MEIWRVVDELVCTRRVPGLGSASLRVLKGQKGEVMVATDPVGVPPGKWVFTTLGSAARLAMPDPLVTTDLTICGIMGGAWLSGRLAGRVAPKRQIQHGFVIMCVVAFVNVIANAVFTAHTSWALFPIAVFAFGWALMVPVGAWSPNLLESYAIT